MVTREKLTERFNFALSPSLKREFKKRAKELNLDDATLARAAFAVVVKQGLSFGNPNGKEESTHAAIN